MSMYSRSIYESLRALGVATILVSDDEETCRHSVQKVLEREGHHVEAVESVDGALERLSARKFDLIVCDYRMPGKTGIDLLAELGRLHSVVPVILISAYADHSTEVTARAMGAVDLLHKPLRRKELIDCVKRAIGFQR